MVTFIALDGVVIFHYIGQIVYMSIKGYKMVRVRDY